MYGKNEVLSHPRKGVETTPLHLKNKDYRVIVNINSLF